MGACRQYLVLKYKGAQGAKGALVGVCKEPSVYWVQILIEVPLVRRFRAGVIESLELNQLHGCLVCDEGRGCHLQDMITGHNYRRFTVKKAHIYKPRARFLS